MAAAACDGAPSLDHHRDVDLLDDDFEHLARHKPLLVPIGAASGMTVAAPASSSRLYSTGSAWM